MEYKEIVAVTGISGLFQLVTTKSDGAVVRNVSDKSIKFISARQHNVTPLDSIEVYTTGENVRLETVFTKMLESETTTPLVNPKVAGNDEIRNYFKSIFPEFDDSRVYVSDMKKMVKWFVILKENDLLNFKENEDALEGSDLEHLNESEVIVNESIAGNNDKDDDLEKNSQSLGEGAVVAEKKLEKSNIKEEIDMAIVKDEKSMNDNQKEEIV